MAAGYIHRTTGTAFTSDQKFTASMWFKGSTPPPADAYMWSIGSSGAHITIYFASNGGLSIVCATPSFTQATASRYRDPSAWYHIVLAVNTTESVEADRVTVWINGEELTSEFWTSRGWPAENDTFDGLASGKIQYIGNNYVDVANYGWLGLMSHVHYCDGYVYTASDFGETDSTSGIWKIKTGPSVSYGNNGYFLKLEDRSNLDLDSGTNAFSFTTTGTVVATYDNPSNNFATWNRVGTARVGGGSLRPTTYTQGNNTLSLGSGGYFSRATGTLGVSAGKWYWETKCVSGTASGDPSIGIIGSDGDQTNYIGATGNPSMVMKGISGQKGYNNAGDTSYGNTYGDGDIVGVALDLDNKAIYLSINNAWQDSGDPTSGASVTGAMYSGTGTSDGFDPATQFWTPFCIGDSAGPAVLSSNFGNGYFGTTAVTSAEADGDGIGAFEYAPPTGYFTLCTKNIKAYGG